MTSVKKKNVLLYADDMVIVFWKCQWTTMHAGYPVLLYHKMGFFCEHKNPQK
jgi:hypothetical protein